MRLLSLIENPPAKPSRKQKKGTLTPRQMERYYRPFAGDIGQLVISWSRLQETFARLFWFVTGISDGAIPLAVWHSTPNDRTQREMLRAAAEVAFTPSILLRKARMPDAPSNKRALEDITWIVNKANSLADKRNDTVHSPFVVSIAQEGNKLAPYHTQGNPRALKLKGKDLSAEFRWYRAQAEVLRPFAYDIATRIRWPDSGPWPDRPQLPRLGQSPIQTTKRRKKIAR